MKTITLRVRATKILVIFRQICKLRRSTDHKVPLKIKEILMRISMKVAVITRKKK